MFAGLQDLGVANGEDLKETLTNCTEPLKAIEQFQTENGVLLPSLQSALPFLDLHGTPRLEFHQSVFDELRDKLLERVSAIATEGKAEERYKKLEDLLEKSFSLVKMPSLQPVVMCVMKHLPKVPEKKLKLVMADKELYRACAVEVKRQIWQDNQALFGDEVSPLLKQYIVEKESALFSTELSVLHNFFSPSPKTRRQGEVVQRLTRMVGRNVKLYDMVLQFLRTLFLRTRNVHYCTLRAELLMSLHDLDVGDICSVDPCHKFTWCLDACIRERFVDSKRARELQGFLDGVKKGQEQVLGDLSMILCDPFAINTLSLSTVRHLQELVGQELLPRDSPDLLLLLRLLALGQGAWDMIDSQVFKEPKMEVELVTRFLPTLMSFVVDDHAFNVDQKLPAEEKAPVSYPSALPETFTKFLQEQRVACEVGLYYVLHITKQRNKNALLRLLPGLVETFSDLAFGDIFLHLLTGNLALLADEFALEDFCSSLFDGFLLTASPRKENVQRHVLRLLLHLHHRVAPSKLEALQKALEPTGQSGEAVKELYSQLGEKLEQLDRRKPSPAQATETPALELPLPSDPSPAQGRPPRMPGAIREGRPTLQPDTRSRPGRSSSFSSLGLLFHVTTCPWWGEIRLHVTPRLPCPQHSPNAGDTQKESLSEPTDTTARSSGLPEEKRKAEPPLSWGQGPCGIPGLPSWKCQSGGPHSSDTSQPPRPLSFLAGLIRCLVSALSVGRRARLQREPRRSHQPPAPSFTHTSVWAP
uniref:Negative elongation factor complex member B n=1 Tax=Monodon monoceros TaxID=40151 RepID=A0A8C6BQJ6_MONMO